MKLFYVNARRIIAVLTIISHIVSTVFATPIVSQLEPTSDDRFTELFKAKAPISEILTGMMYVDPLIAYHHFQEILDHANKKDDYATYAKSLITVLQKLLDNFLISEMNYNEKVDIVEFVEALCNLPSGSSPPDPNMMNLLMKMRVWGENTSEEVMKKCLEKSMEIVERYESEEREAYEKKSVEAPEKQRSDNTGIDGNAHGRTAKGHTTPVVHNIESDESDSKETKRRS